MAIRLHDSLTRSLKELRRPDPADPQDLFTFYNCGPTVYAPAHIGNFRTFVVNDVLRRLLELEFGPGKVKHVRNLTDVDDRTIGQAKKEQRPLAEITRKWTDLFHADCAALNCLPPHVEPTATGHIREQVDMIEVLMEKGNAYRAPDGSVYFKIASFPEYGALSRIKERELKVTHSAFDDDHKDDLGDFALWKAHKPDEDGDVQWPGPRTAAAGRPGWHIECSAMSKKHLGETIDLHTGGVDLLFPHHENEIAQSQCCNGTTFARHWYHSEHLLVDGTTMSKSKGNYYTLGDLLEKGYSPMAVRYALLYGRKPREQQNFTLEALNIAEKSLQRIYAALDKAGQQSGLAPGTFLRLTPSSLEGLLHPNNKSVFAQCLWVLEDDLNIPSCIGEFFVGVHGFETSLILKDRLRFEITCALTILNTLGLRISAPVAVQIAAPADITTLAEKRWAAKQAKDFVTADALRKELAAAGWSMLDRKDGYSLEPLKK
jgi:cysteinyl-tRNA synthetase